MRGAEQVGSDPRTPTAWLQPRERQKEAKGNTTGRRSGGCSPGLSGLSFICPDLQRATCIQQPAPVPPRGPSSEQGTQGPRCTGHAGQGSRPARSPPWDHEAGTPSGGCLSTGLPGLERSSQVVLVSCARQAWLLPLCLTGPWDPHDNLMP